MENSEENYSLKEDPVKVFRELLFCGEIKQAVEYKRNKALDQDVVFKHTREAFSTHKDLGEYEWAISIAKLFKFSYEDIQEAGILHIKNLHKDGEFEKAAKWAIDNDLSEVEVTRSATLAFERYLKAKQVESALRVFDDFRLKKEDLLAVTIEVFNKSLKDGDFHTAAFLGERFHFSKERTVNAAAKACMATIKNRDFVKANDIIRDFRLFSQENFELITGGEAKSLINEAMLSLIEPLCEAENLQPVVGFAQNTNIMDMETEILMLNEFSMDFVKKMVKTHNNLLNLGKVKSAKYLRESLKLLANKRLNPELMDSIQEAAVNYHHRLIEEENLPQALKFKEEFNLFGPGTDDKTIAKLHEELSVLLTKLFEKPDINAAKALTTEYNLPDPVIVRSILDSLLGLLDDDKLQEAIMIINDFNINLKDEDVRVRVTMKFNDLMSRKAYVVAIEVAKSFHLGKAFFEKAAYKAWEEQFAKRSYAKASQLKNSYKIPKKLMLPLAKKTYHDFKQKKDYEMAVHIRKSYSVPVGLIEWLSDILQLLFTRK